MPALHRSFLGFLWQIWDHSCIIRARLPSPPSDKELMNKIWILKQVCSSCGPLLLYSCWFLLISSQWRMSKKLVHTDICYSFITPGFCRNKLWSRYMSCIRAMVQLTVETSLLDVNGRQRQEVHYLIMKTTTPTSRPLSHPLFCFYPDSDDMPFLNASFSCWFSKTFIHGFCLLLSLWILAHTLPSALPR